MNNAEILIVTHDGQFHADETFAVGIATTTHPNAIVRRSREKSVIETADMVIDVGGMYDPILGRFDHHQPGCDEKYSDEYIIPMSSIGMVWKEFAYDYLRTMYGQEIITHSLNIKSIADALYRTFILEIDAIDNGTKQTDKKNMSYFIYTNLSTTISKMNTNDIYNPDVQNEAFFNAVNYAMMTFNIHVHAFMEKAIGVIKDTQTITNAMVKRFEYSKTGEILVIPYDCPNWLHCIRLYENKNPYPNPSLDVKFLIYPNDGESWRIRAMSGKEQFQNRKNLKGVEDILKIDPSLKNNITFVHEKRFIGGALDVNTAVKMGTISLLEQQ